MTLISIPNSITSIGNTAFQNCRSLISIIIPNLVTTIGNNAFLNCTNLISVTIANNQLTGITSPASNISFFGATVITILPSVIFSGTGILTQARVNANIGTMASVIIDGYTDISNNAFNGKTQITSVTIGTSVKTIGISAFQDCTNLTSITIPNSVTSIGNTAFQNCTNLTLVTIGSSLTTIGNNAFLNCNNLTVAIANNQLTGIISPTTGSNSLLDVHYSTNYGVSFTKVSNVLTQVGSDLYVYGTCMSADGSTIYIAMFQKIYKSTDYGASWTLNFTNTNITNQGFIFLKISSDSNSLTSSLSNQII
jgi:hypothetical protein